MPNFHDHIQYNPLTGSFKWLTHGPKRQAGGPAGRYDSRGYLCITFNGVTYRAANLAWYLTHGEWPKGVIDHKDRNYANNKLDNLRDISQRMNCLNRHRYSKTGLPKGVYWMRGTYHVIIYLFGRNNLLGKFNTLEEATALAEVAYKKQWELAERWEHVEKKDRETKWALLKELRAVGL